MSTSDLRGWGTTAARPLVYLTIASFLVLTLAYQFTPPVTVDIGSGNDTAFVQGFSFRENMADGSFRWSGARGEIRLWGLGNQNGKLRLRVAAPRPDRAAQVQVFANDIKMGDIEPGGSFQEYTFPVDRAVIGAGGDLVVTLASDTFTQAPDTRELGVQVDYARFESGSAPVLPSPRSLYLIALTLLSFIVALIWSGSALAAKAAAALLVLVEAIGLVARVSPGQGPARVETVWFAAPLFWFGVTALAGALVLVWALQKVSLGRNGASLSPKTMRALFAVMGLAFAVRMLFATGPGFIVDVQDYVVWSYKTVTFGLGTAYASFNGLWVADQSPGLVYLLHIMGTIYRAVFSPDFLYPGVAGDPAVRAANALTTNPALLADPVQRTLLRVPSLLADLATGALLFAAVKNDPSPSPSFTRRSEDPGLAKRGQTVSPGAPESGGYNARPRWAWLVALGYLFNPAVLWNGAYWGQTDAVHALLVLIAFLLLGGGRVGAAFFTLGIAVLTKPQAAIFGPLLLLWAWKTPTFPSHPLSSGEVRPARTVVTAAFAFALGAVLMPAPMLIAGGGSGMLGYFLDTIGHHPILSANAHNLWWFLTNGKIDIPDTSELVPGVLITFRQAGLILFGAFYLAVLAKAWRTAGQDYFALGAFLGFAFFMLPTEIHENYGYALLPLLALAMANDRIWIAFYVAVSATMVLNYALSDPPLFALFGVSDPTAQLAFPRQLNALANTAVFAAWALYLFVRRGVAVRQEPGLAPQSLTR